MIYLVIVNMIFSVLILTILLFCIKPFEECNRYAHIAGFNLLKCYRPNCYCSNGKLFHEDIEKEEFINM